MPQSGKIAIIEHSGFARFVAFTSVQGTLLSLLLSDCDVCPLWCCHQGKQKPLLDCLKLSTG